MNAERKQELFYPGDTVWFETADGHDFTGEVIDDDGGSKVLVLISKAVLHKIYRHLLVHADYC